MKKTLIFLVFMLPFTLPPSPFPLFCAFKDPGGWGVRPSGMGCAFTAVADDSNGPLYNPAGVAQVIRQEASFMSSKLFTGLEGVEIGMNYFSYIRPINNKYGGAAFTWASLNSPALYREDTVCISYGRTLNDILHIKKYDLYFGFSAKYFRHEYDLDFRTAGDPVFESGTSKGALSQDFGIIANFPKIGVALGLSSKNITKPDVGLKTEDLVENENVAGVAYRNKLLPVVGLPGFTASFDYVKRGSYTDYRFGAETVILNDRFAIRTGARSQEFTFGLGYTALQWAKGSLAVDYAFAWPLEIENTTGSHRIGVMVKF